MAKPLVYRDGEPFPGHAAATLAESVPAWPVPARAPAGAPNVVLVVLDDVGFAQIGCTTVSSPQPLAPGRHVVGVALEPASGNGMRAELVVGGDVVAVGEAPRTAKASAAATTTARPWRTSTSRRTRSPGRSTRR